MYAIIRMLIAEVIMKKKFLSIAFAVLMLSTCFLMTGCFNQKDTYLAVIPTDQYYTATLSYRRQNSTSDYLENWKVVRKQANICDNNYDAIYVEYSFADNNDDSHDYSRTLLYIYHQCSGLVFSHDGSQWERYSGSFGDKWADIYGSMSKPGSFVYEMTADINGRDFPKRYKTAETEEYIEYTFSRDQEKFRISNDPYHILLYYNFEYQDTHLLKQATIQYNSTDIIPDLNTITAEKLA